MENSSVMINRVPFLLLVISVVFAGNIYAEDPVDFADTNLKAAVEAALGVTDPNATDMLALSTLTVQNMGIVDLEGIQYAVNLLHLNLAQNSISGISLLSALTNLRELDLSYNNITNISPLSGLTDLEYVYLGSNNVESISALSTLTNLTSLGLNNNNITDISALSGLTNLTSLSIGSNNVTDISALFGLTSLTTLDLNSNNISDISVLSDLINLTTLCVSDNNITDISVLSSLIDLTYLYIGRNNIADISSLSTLTDLVWLDISLNDISDISALSNLTNLTFLILNINRITNISALSALVNLAYLNLNYNPLGQFAYCVYLPLIQKNNPGLNLFYDSGECTLNCFNTCLEGTWYLRGLYTQKNGQADNFGYDIGVLDFQENGAFSGTIYGYEGNSWNEAGISTLGGGGAVNLLSITDEIAIHSAINSHRDFMALNYEEANEVALEVLIKQGDNYSNADIEGTWYVRGLQTARNGYPDSFANDSGTFVVQSDGSFDANWPTRTETGTAIVEPNGIVTLTFDGGGVTQAVLNANKDVMAHNWQLTAGPENELGIDIFVKKGSSYSLADLVGDWFYHSLGTAMNGQPDNFGYDTITIKIQEEGIFLYTQTGTTSEENGGALSWGTGTASIDPNGVVSLNFDSESLILNPVMSAGKDVMINNYTDPDNELGLEIFVKKGNVEGDLNFDGKTDFEDFAIFADDWLEGTD